uniref:Uncharacterized protein n=1 Tax=Anguilla anguilla TaxID=7936 RepID=A0A0E9PUA1_ANGAN
MWIQKAEFPREIVS